MKVFRRLMALLICVLVLTACGAKPASAPEATAAAEVTTLPTEPASAGIRNIILIIGDGMGMEQIEAGEIAKGEPFVFRQWQHTLADTNSVNSDGELVLTDSAAAGTALATGQLTTNGKVGQGPKDNAPLTTILDHAHAKGKATGVVSTDTMYGATPAAFSGHAPSRSDTETILYSQLTSDVDLLCSGFDDEVMNIKGAITGAGYTFCDFLSDIEETKSGEKVYWQFDMAGASASAKLEKVVPHALDFLSRDEDGFVMMIEQAHVDKYCHSNEIEGAQICANSLNNTVSAVLEWCGDRTDTAIIITADHETGGLSVSAQDEYENRYVTKDGNAIYYQWTTTGHSNAPVGVYLYGFAPDLSRYYMEGETDLIKNTAVFQMMLALLEDPVRWQQ